MRTRVLLGISVTLIFAALSSASAAVITSNGDAWTWDLPQYANNEFGHGTTNLLLENAPSRTALTLTFARFNISGVLGANERFASAKLSFYISGNTGVNNDIFWVYAISEAGDQKVSDSMTLSTQPIWTGEFVGLGAEVNPGTAGTVGWISFETSTILDYVNADTDGVISFAVRQVAATGGVVNICAHEHASTSVHPKFEYTVETIPEPTSLCGVAMIGMVALLRRTRK